MKYIELLINKQVINERNDKKGPVEHITKYDHLYHLMNSESFNYNIRNNSLTSRRWGYVSTTWDVSLGNFTGSQAYAYKFSLNAKKLAEKYGIFTYEFWTNYTDRNGGEYLDEREIGINTDKITPLTDYLESIILNNPSGRLNSTTFLWLHFGKLRGWKFNTEDALKIARDEWNIPIMIQSKGNIRQPTDFERQYLKDIAIIANKSKDINDLIYKVSRKYNITDSRSDNHDSSSDSAIQSTDDRKMSYYDRKKIALKIQNKILDYLGKQYRYQSAEKAEKLFLWFLNRMGFGDNSAKYIASIISEKNLFHPAFGYKVWFDVLKDSVDYGNDDIEQIEKHLGWELKNYTPNRIKSSMEFWEERPKSMTPTKPYTLVM